MNVFLRKLLLFSVFLLPVMAAAQDVELTTYWNGTMEYQFSSNRYAPTLHINPLHGEAEMIALGDDEYIVRFTPNDFYVGADFIEIRRWVVDPFPLPKKLRLYVDVIPAEIDAVHDYYVTMVDEPVTMHPLDNDFSSNGVLDLLTVPLANSGAATANPDGTITFTPAVGFEGLAHFNYVVCNGAGICDDGTVSVSVLNDGTLDGEPQVNRIKIFTEREQPQDVLVPDMFALVTPPTNGIYDPSEDVPQYTPNVDFAGIDFMTFQYQNQTVEVEVVVLDHLDNKFAFDDFAYTTSLESVEFDVTANDGEGSTDNTITFAQPTNGTINVIGNGEVEYVPNQSFGGVDEIVYTSTSPEGAVETATAFVHVSNYEPTSSKFYMITPKQTPLIIGYNVPINSFEFSIAQQGSLGQAVFLPGEVDELINGVRITGYNLIVYIPNDDVTTGLDEFEINYCTIDPEAGACFYTKAVKIEMEIIDPPGEGPFCFGDCVWAGDTNFDGVVNMQDLLPLGLDMGEVGEVRENVDLNQWYGQFAIDWLDFFNDNPVNLKHLDTDGDGIVTGADADQILKFYGNTHSLTPKMTPFYDFGIYLEGDIFASPGDLIELKINLGSESNPAIDVYGFTFPFRYNAEIFDPESISISFDENSWMSYNSPILHLSHNDKKGLAEAGYTRTSGISASGLGTIGTVGFVIEDDVIGFRIDEDGNEILPVQLGGTISNGLAGNGESFRMNIGEFTLNIIPRKEVDKDTPIDPSQLKVNPNPTQGQLWVHLNGGDEFEEIVIHNIMGQEVMRNTTGLTNDMKLDVAHLNNGLYILSVYTDRGVVNKKFEVVKY